MAEAKKIVDDYARDRNRSLCAWLIDADPAIQWQVQADVFHAPPCQVARDRSRVRTEGWGAHLLARQDRDGRWAGALYSPKWTSTTYTLLLLERLGLEAGDSQALAGVGVLWNEATWYGGGMTFAKSVRQPEICITAMLVFLATAFGHRPGRLDETVGWLLEHQRDDRGWNCEEFRHGCSHSSFHTTISVLEALLRYRDSGGAIDVASAITEGREFLLDHRLYKSHRTGEVVDPALLRFPFPPQWHYDIMRALEFFRASGAQRDERLADAVSVVGSLRRSDGRWPMFRPYPGRQWLRMESRGPSRWSTLRALRVLEWWEGTEHEESEESRDVPVN